MSHLSFKQSTSNSGESISLLSETQYKYLWVMFLTCLLGKLIELFYLVNYQWF